MQRGREQVWPWAVSRLQGKRGGQEERGEQNLQDSVMVDWAATGEVNRGRDPPETKVKF